MDHVGPKLLQIEAPAIPDAQVPSKSRPQRAWKLKMDHVRPELLQIEAPAIPEAQVPSKSRLQRLATQPAAQPAASPPLQSLPACGRSLAAVRYLVGRVDA